MEASRKRPREAAPTADAGPLSAARATQICTDVARELRANMEQRVRFAAEPRRFMESELALHERVRALRALGSEPQRFGEAVAADLPASLAELATHPNLDLVKEVLELLAELVDTDTLAEAPEAATQLVDGLVDAGLLAALADAVPGFDEREETGQLAVYTAMDVLENMVGARAQVAIKLMDTSLLRFLLERVCRPEYDANKLYCSEMLSILLTSSPANRQRFATAAAPATPDANMQTLVAACATTRLLDPGSLEEEECAANVLGALASVVLERDNALALVRVRGVPEMLGIAKARRFTYPLALKVLADALEGCREACEALIEDKGLPVVCPLLMGRALSIKVAKEDVESALGGKAPAKRPHRHKSKRKREEVEREVTASVIAVFGSLFRHLEPGTVAFRRVVRKFREESFEKADRLVALHARFAAALQALDASGLSEEERFLEAVDRGQEQLRTVDYVIARLLTDKSAAADVGARLRDRLAASSCSVQQVAASLEAFAAELGGASPFATEVRGLAVELHGKALDGAP